MFSIERYRNVNYLSAYSLGFLMKLKLTLSVCCLLLLKRMTDEGRALLLLQTVDVYALLPDFRR